MSGDYQFDNIIYFILFQKMYKHINKMFIEYNIESSACFIRYENHQFFLCETRLCSVDLFLLNCL